MPLTNSPKFEDEFDSTRPEPPLRSGDSALQAPSATRRWRRVIIGVLTLLVLISGSLLVARQGGTAAVLVGSATIRGQVVNLQGTGVPDAEVFVEGMSFSVKTDETGVFSISGAPGGQLVIVLGVTPEAPHFLTVSVGANAVKDLGLIVYQPGIK